MDRKQRKRQAAVCSRVRGRYEVLNTRPLPEKIREYFMQDVQLLHRLWRHYHAKMSSHCKKRVESATQG